MIETRNLTIESSSGNLTSLLCASTISAGRVISNISMWSDPILTQSVFSLSTTLSGDNTLWANAIMVQGALAVTTTSSSPLSSSSGVSIPKPSSSNPVNQSFGTRLSAGAKAGIAVGITVLFFAIILGVFFYFRRRGQRIRRVEADSHPSAANFGGFSDQKPNWNGSGWGPTIPLLWVGYKPPKLRLNSRGKIYIYLYFAVNIFYQ